MVAIRSTALVAILVWTAATALSATDPFSRRLPPETQPAHLLNRLGFGPRPGDVSAVERIGVEVWIRRQLRPDGIPQNPALETQLAALGTLRLPTWQIYETYEGAQPGMMMMAAGGPRLRQLLTGDQLQILQSGTEDERRRLLRDLPDAIRRPVLLVLPAKALDGLSDLQVEAFNARAAEQRRLRPPLTEILTEAQLTALMRGTDAEKTALIESLDPERRAQVFRQTPPAAVPEPFRRETIALAQPARVPLLELTEAKLLRAVYSHRQLEEVLVDFWLNHFNVFSGKGPVRMMLTSYERDAIRPYVLGRFRDMLLATARHPAMLFYLDNWLSRAPRDDDPGAGLNENYGRELLELHTLGVDGGYTQEDVVDVARAFTGWTIHEPERYGEFFFNPAMHDREEKVILGLRLPRGGGEEEGVRVIDMLAAHPSTARFIAQKLAQRFVADDPPPALVDRVAATFSRTGGDLRAVMEALLLSGEFLSEGAWQAKVKSPFEMVVSSLRALNADVTDTVPIAQRIADLGQPLYGQSDPTGYPNASGVWANSAGLLGRMNLAAALVSGQVPGVSIDAGVLRPDDPARAAAALIGHAPAAATVAALGAATVQSPESLAAVVIASPDFQRR
jgi:uncharacterized protein (DUF1800 family)